MRGIYCVALTGFVGLVGCGEVTPDLLQPKELGATGWLPSYVDLEVGESAAFTTADNVEHTVTLQSQSLDEVEVEVDGIYSTFDLRRDRCGSPWHLLPRKLSGVLVLPEVVSDIQNACQEYDKDRRYKYLKVAWETGNVEDDRDVEDPGYARLLLFDPAHDLPAGEFPVDSGPSCESMLNTRRPFLVPSSYGFHHGVDLHAPIGSPLVAVQGGTISRIYDSCLPDGSDSPECGSCGNGVDIENDDFIFHYCHFRTVSSDLEVGQTVAAGDYVGEIGMTGLTSTPHLHFNMWLRDYRDPPIERFGVSPYPYLDAWCRGPTSTTDYAVYEDAEDGTTTGWRVYDNTPAGATFANIFDSDRQSRVIEVSGNGTSTGCHLRNSDGSLWQDTTNKSIIWSMRFSEDFTIYVKTRTDAGTRYLTYQPVNQDDLGGGSYVWFGLGSDVVDGEWRTFARDLQADLERAQPGVQILEVNGFYIRGSGRLDDIRLSTGPEIYEDAEDGGTEGWRVYDNTPAGAAFANVDDPIRQSKVIELSGNGTSTGCQLRNADGSFWRDETRSVLSFDMNYEEDFTMYVRLETSVGKRYLTYSQAEFDLLGSGTYIRFGLGANMTNGHWSTVTRDLQLDLERAQPGVEILEVNGIYVRGSGRLDDIVLF